MDLNTEKYRNKELGNFLKIRRARILPSQVGISGTARRRTPGLRREEVAQLAGISISWYTWLEQGRDIQVSSQVIESLSRVLLLTKQEQEYLQRLANLPVSEEESDSLESISLVIQDVLDSIIYCPALVIDQRWNIVAWNKSAVLVFDDFSKLSINERNVVWNMFTNDKYKKIYGDWELYAKELLGKFRLAYSHQLGDIWLIRFIENLKIHSDEFNCLWSLHDIESYNESHRKLNHPTVGELEFVISKLKVSNDTRLNLIIYTPLSETETHKKMKMLVEE